MSFIGIACDPYKLPKFEELLKREGFTDYEIRDEANGKQTFKIIKIKTSLLRQPDIKKICQEAENSFGNRRNRRNAKK